MCEQCQAKAEQDARFWRAVRRALLMVASAIADRYPEGHKHKRAA